MIDKFTLNDGHIHEAIDRIDVAIHYLQASLAEHALIQAVAGYQAKVQDAINILSDLYQEIGRNNQIADIAKQQRQSL